MKDDHEKVNSNQINNLATNSSDYYDYFFDLEEPEENGGD